MPLGIVSVPTGRMTDTVAVEGTAEQEGWTEDL